MAPREPSQTDNAIRKRESRLRKKAEEQRDRDEAAAIAQRIRENKAELKKAADANQKMRSAKSKAKKKKEKEEREALAALTGFINGSGSVANFASFQPLDAFPNAGAGSAAAKIYLQQPSSHASLPAGIDRTVQFMAVSHEGNANDAMKSSREKRELFLQGFCKDGQFC
jgi:hypothetical protein